MELADDYKIALTKSWRNEAWINSGQLNRHTVMDYFKDSPFYDRNCCQETLKRQGFDPTQENLRKMTGVQYELLGGDQSRIDIDGWFVIRKLYRASTTDVKILQHYYVMGPAKPGQSPNAPPFGTVIPLPDMHSVFSTAVQTCVDDIRSSFNDVKAHSSFNFCGKYGWVFAPAGGSTSGGKDDAELPDSRYEPLAQQCLDLLISKKLP
mmetsp:Transcript_7177/g.13599  ORF Transcript_7177/g.13599 Transcript_7177/m.13599 type:complete len:208 (-) Transcript_7177:412-1035(-)|eukprot:CAMPEP_0175153056 /NCGR_PEP_ID=MMETSP0087-20121206/19500_1 /TAXON_ID=136419 /ORGANISM="Unknown Unknown, Strain D1" /LENGTH=207 /DNA_ID=CAMNT_0016439643 /DNA_START=22 /DNA_END=645 /DNA_ORIENTATION=-